MGACKLAEMLKCVKVLGGMCNVSGCMLKRPPKTVCVTCVACVGTMSSQSSNVTQKIRALSPPPFGEKAGKRGKLFVVFLECPPQKQNLSVGFVLGVGRGDSMLQTTPVCFCFEGVHD